MLRLTVRVVSLFVVAGVAGFATLPVTAAPPPAKLTKKCIFESAAAVDRAPAAARMIYQTKKPVPKSDAGALPDDLAPQSVTISVHVHVIKSTTGAGEVADATINQQIAVLNQAFAGQLGGLATPTAFKFALASVDRTTNNAWYTVTPETNAERDMKQQLHKGGKQALNLYIAHIPDGYLEWSAFPWDHAAAPKMDGVVVLNDALPGGAASPYNIGHQAVHAVGHWLGLYHPFQGGCSGPGDYVADTSAEKNGTFGCPAGQNTCPGTGQDPIHNFMDYTDDACTYELTPGQSARMTAMWIQYRY